MDFGELVQTRRSVRGFKKEPVPRGSIEELLEVAKRAPSSMNTQPWHVHVLSGEPLEQIRRRNMEEMIAGARPQRDIVTHGEYQGVHRYRQVEIAKKLFGAMGIARSDIVREVAGIPEDQVIMTCAAMGYPDDSFPANGVRSDRPSNGDFVRFVGFAE
jgi:nitroreductase